MVIDHADDLVDIRHLAQSPDLPRGMLVADADLADLDPLHVIQSS